MQHYDGFACFLRSRWIPKRSKIDEKTYLENVTEKNFDFYQNMPKSTSKWIPEGWLFYLETHHWAIVSCFFSFLVPKSAKKSPQGVPGIADDR